MCGTMCEAGEARHPGPWLARTVPRCEALSRLLVTGAADKTYTLCQSCGHMTGHPDDVLHHPCYHLHSYGTVAPSLRSPPPPTLLYCTDIPLSTGAPP